MAFRPKVLALASKITAATRTGVVNIPSDPEYRILDCVITDEQVDVALCVPVRKDAELPEIAAKCGKSPEETRRIYDRKTLREPCGRSSQ
jgi:hypothetical protein